MILHVTSCSWGSCKAQGEWKLVSRDCFDPCIPSSCGLLPSWRNLIINEIWSLSPICSWHFNLLLKNKTKQNKTKKTSSSCAHGIFSNVKEIFQGLILFCCAVWQKSRVSFPSESPITANQRHTDIRAESSRPVPILLSSVSVVWDSCSMWMCEWVWEISWLTLYRYVYQEFIFRLRILLPHLPSTHGTQKALDLLRSVTDREELQGTI